MKFSGQRLARARGDAHITQEELAQRAGLSMFTVSRLERDLHAPELATIAKLAQALDLQVDDLLVPEGVAR